MLFISKSYAILFVFSKKLTFPYFTFPHSLTNMLKETSTPTRPVENVVITSKGLQRRNTHMLDGTTMEK